MGEVIKFPANQKPTLTEAVGDGINNPESFNILEFKKKANIKAFLSESSPRIVIGGEIIIEVLNKKYNGIVTEILQRDANNNITRIAYNIPFLNSNDPFKFGEANFTYSIKKI